MTINELRKKVLDLINKRMRKYVNLPLNERQSAFYELSDLESDIVRLFDCEEKKGNKCTH